MNKLKIGDTIKCIDAEDAVNLMEELLRGGYDCDFRYEMNGEKGIWLEIIEEEYE